MRYKRPISDQHHGLISDNDWHFVWFLTDVINIRDGVAIVYMHISPTVPLPLSHRTTYYDLLWTYFVTCCIWLPIFLNDVSKSHFSIFSCTHCTISLLNK